MNVAARIHPTNAPLNFATGQRTAFARLIIFLLLSFLTVTSGLTFAADPPAAKLKHRARRVLYNFDGDSCLSTKAGGKGPVAVNVDDLKRLIEEVAYEGSRVDTVLVCINAQVMYYPTKVGTLRGTISTAEERSKWGASEKQRFENLKAFFDKGVDPYALMLAETKRRGREAILTFRMNDDHGNDFLRTQFYVDHPDCRMGRGALDFGRDEVRDYTYRLIEEAVRRYDSDGIELDFNRFPAFFKDGTTDVRVAKMNSLVERVRKLLDQLGRDRGRRLVLSVRPPSNYGKTPPTPETARQIGCDVPAWVKNGWVDFVAVSEFLFERGNLPIRQWKQAIDTVPVYGGIECTSGRVGRNLTADEYRHAAAELIKAGADGVYLFNFFTSREEGEKSYEPPFEIFRDLGTLLSANRKHLFVDDFAIAKSDGVRRVWHVAQKANDGQPIQFTKRDEKGNKVPLRASIYASALHNAERNIFQMWSRVFPGLQAGQPLEGSEIHKHMRYGYCESRDGIHFDFVSELKGLHSSGDYNIVVTLDPNETEPTHRYKAGYDGAPQGFPNGACLAHSIDGIDWTPYKEGKPVTGRAADFTNCLVWDAPAETYRLFTRTDYGTGGGPGEIRGMRMMTNPDVRKNPTAWKTVHQWKFDREGPEEHRRRQIYTMTDWQYCDVHFGLFSIYEWPNDFSEGKVTDHAKRHERDVINTYLATSRDATHWDLSQIYAGKPLIERGGDKAWDKDMLFPSSWIITHNDEHWIYYGAANERHGVGEIFQPKRQFDIGLAKLRLDRFAGLRADETAGTIVTKPFKLMGNQIVVNADARRGDISVELLDVEGKPIAGFSGADAALLTDADDVRWYAPWKLPGLNSLGKPLIQLRFHLRNATLYSFRQA